MKGNFFLTNITFSTAQVQVDKTSKCYYFTINIHRSDAVQWSLKIIASDLKCTWLLLLATLILLLFIISSS